MNISKPFHTRKGWYFISCYLTHGKNKHPLWVGPFKTEQEALSEANKDFAKAVV